jgi:hypothetical protein
LQWASTDAGDGRLGRRGQEGDVGGGGHRGDVRVGQQLRVADEQEPAGPGEAPQGLHGADDLTDLGGSAVVGPPEHRDGSVGGGGHAGLDLFQVGAAVLGVAEPGPGEVLVDARVVAVQADRGHVPVQLGHVDAVAADRGGPDRPGHLVQDRGQRVQRPGDPVVVEDLGSDPEGVLHGELPAPLPEVDHRGR